MVNEQRLHIVLAISMFLCGVWWIYQTISKSKENQDASWDIIFCILDFIMTGINLGYLLYVR